MIIDGHNDLVLHRWRGEPALHLDLDAAVEAGFSGGCFALYVPSPSVPDPEETPYAMPLPEPIPHEEAARVAEELFAALCELPVGQVPRRAAERVCVGVRRDERRVRQGLDVPEARLVQVRQVDKDAEPVAGAHELAARVGQPASGVGR